MLEQLIIDYVNDPDDFKKNFNLAQEYFNLGQTAAAISFYLRSAEKTESKDWSYDCLIMIGKCFDLQGNRDYTVKAMYRTAMSLLPKRPEAYYFISRKFEAELNYAESYNMAVLGLELSQKDKESTLLGYAGEWMLLFQKSVAAFWIGKGMESRRLLQDLINDHWDKMDILHKKAIEQNLINLGSGPKEYAHRTYNKNLYPKLRYKFPGSENIERNFSQVYQDMFVLSMTKGKKNGTFLEIGAANPWLGSNTFLLESQFGWKGVSIEYDEKFIKELRDNRKAKILHQDALKTDYRQLLKENFEGNVIDYLQLDIEPARNTYDCMLKIPFDEYKFRVITYEHDYYADVTRTYKNMSREFLRSKGYVLVGNDIAPDDMCSFEDWWVHPDLVDKELIKFMKAPNEKVNAVEQYMLTEEEKFYEWDKCDKYIRETFFPDRTYKGVMVEVGAGPPEFLSMSKHWRDSGWRAICVEPNPKFVKQHKELGNEIYQYACADEEGLADFTINLNNDKFYTPDQDGVSFSALDIRLPGVPEHNTQEKIKVEKLRLDTLLSNLKVDKIDLLSVDVEGWELEVMKGFNAAKYSPKIIMLENNTTLDYEPYMNSIGYEKNTTIGGNEIYIKYEKAVSVIFNINKGFAKRAFIVDNFYEDPYAIRTFAQKQEYLEGGFGKGFIGRRTKEQFLFPGLKETFEAIMSKRITKWQEHGTNGRFQINYAGEPIVYHCDDQTYAAMIYLTPDAPPECGTSTFRHRATRLRHRDEPNIQSAFTYKTFLDRTPYDKVDQFGNVFNRLVIFDAGCIHGANEYFGYDMETARLWHMFFFDAE